MVLLFRNKMENKHELRNLLIGMLAAAGLGASATYDWMESRCERKLYEQKKELIKTFFDNYSWSTGRLDTKKLLLELYPRITRGKND